MKLSNNILLVLLLLLSLCIYGQTKTIAYTEEIIKVEIGYTSAFSEKYSATFEMKKMLLLVGLIRMNLIKNFSNHLLLMMCWNTFLIQGNILCFK